MGSTHTLTVSARSVALAKCAATSLVASTSKTLVCCTSCLGGRRPSNGLPKSGRGAPLKTARRNQAQSVAGGPFEDGQAQEGSPFLLTTTNSINSGDQQIETKLARNLRCRGLVHWRTRGGFDVSYAAPARAVRKLNSCSKLPSCMLGHFTLHIASMEDIRSF